MPNLCHSKKPEPVMLKAMTALKLPVDKNLEGCSLEDMLNWAVQNWDINKLSKLTATPEAEL